MSRKSVLLFFGSKMPGVRITSLRPYRKDRLSGRSFAVLSNVRLLWAFFSSAAGGRESERKKAQRSKFCGAAQQNFGNRKGRRCRRCRVFESPHSDQIERPPFGAVFCGIKQCALALGFFLERCRRQRILHLAFSHIFLTGEGVDEAGTFFPKCFYCRWSQRPHFLKYFAN